MRDRAGSILGHPLTVAAVGAIFAGYAGFATGQATTTQRVADMERRIGLIEARQNTRLEFMMCATRSLDQLQANTGVRPPCDLKLPE